MWQREWLGTDVEDPYPFSERERTSGQCYSLTKHHRSKSRRIGWGDRHKQIQGHQFLRERRRPTPCDRSKVTLIQSQNVMQFLKTACTTLCGRNVAISKQSQNRARWEPSKYILMQTQKEKWKSSLNLEIKLHNKGRHNLEAKIDPGWMW